MKPNLKVIVLYLITVVFVLPAFYLNMGLFVEGFDFVHTDLFHFFAIFALGLILKTLFPTSSLKDFAIASALAFLLMFLNIADIILSNPTIELIKLKSFYELAIIYPLILFTSIPGAYFATVLKTKKFDKNQSLVPILLFVIILILILIKPILY